MRIASVALPTPLRRLFDYIVPAGAEVLPGARVRVPFGRGMRTGVVVGLSGRSEVPTARLKPLHRVVDESPLLDAVDLGLLEFAAAYFQHSLGDALAGALPKLLRGGRPLEAAIRNARASRPGVPEARYRLTRTALAAASASLSRAPRQARICAALKSATDPGAGTSAGELDAVAPGWRAPMNRLVERGFVERLPAGAAAGAPAPRSVAPALSAGQTAALERVWGANGGYAAFLLDGVTGSGKTEVYLGLAERVVAQGRQVLVLIPEIALTPQLSRRFAERLGRPVATLHSGLSDSERLLSWCDARAGDAMVVLGTRSAVFTPMPHLGLVVVDEEHDASLKQQDGFRYNARDLAVKRAADRGVPVVLGSATPSLESIRNVQLNRYTRLALPERAGSATAPEPELVDVRGQLFDEGLSVQLAEALRALLDRSEQALLFINRRGYAPLVLCHECGGLCECRRCDARMVFHAAARGQSTGPAGLRGLLRCHHCGAQRPPPDACPACGSASMRVLGLGTARVARALEDRFPAARVARLDRDNTRRRGSLEAILDRVRTRKIDILVGTQMLAKGHDFPAVTLVGILDADAGLFGTDFRAAERMAQLLVQVSGRAGRGERPGRVLVQTHHPAHPLLGCLIHGGYAAFAGAALAERREAGLPPFSSAALLRAEAPAPEPGKRFLAAARALLAPPGGKLRAMGPVPAPMERRAGRYRAQLYLEADSRAEMQSLLGTALEGVAALPEARAVRWSIDVDPQDTL